MPPHVRVYAENLHVHSYACKIDCPPEILWTSLPVATFDDAWRVIEYYAQSFFE